MGGPEEDQEICYQGELPSLTAGLSSLEGLIVAGKNIPALCGALLLVVTLSGCATYSDWVGRMEADISQGKPDKALKVLEKHASSKDEVLYQLNRAMLQRMAGDYEASNVSFEAAKAMISSLSAISVSEQGGALTVNDMMRSYTGDYYEQVLIHVFESLNYLALNQPDQARVEALQLDEKLKQHGDNSKYEDGFARYLTGIIYEDLGEWDDAMIAYRQAYKAYRRYPQQLEMPVPQQLKSDLIRLADKVGLTDEARRYREKFDIQSAPQIPASDGELIFLLNTGLAPLKRSIEVRTITESGQLVTVAMPAYEDRRPTVTAARVSIDGDSATTDLVENVDSLAMDALAKQKPLILARAIGRAVIKTKASKEADSRNDALGLMLNIANAITERADTRSWSTLPNLICLARLPLAAGRHQVQVELLDRLENVVGKKDYDVDIGKRDKHFISLDWIMANDLIAINPLRRR